MASSKSDFYRALQFFTDRFSFAAGFMEAPRAVASLFPSSSALSHTIAAQVDPNKNGIVLELGPGTGAVTRSLLEWGVAPDRLILIEQSSRYIVGLQAKFPHVRIIAKDALDVRSVTSQWPTIDAVVSGLPLLNIPNEERIAMVDAYLARMEPGRPFVQLTFGSRSPIPETPYRRVTKIGRVLRNFPPATVWVYHRRLVNPVPKISF